MISKCNSRSSIQKMCFLLMVIQLNLQSRGCECYCQQMVMLISPDRINLESTPGLMLARLLSLWLVRPEMKMWTGSWGIKVCLECLCALLSLSDLINMSGKNSDAGKGKSSSLYSYFICMTFWYMSVKIHGQICCPLFCKLSLICLASVTFTEDTK